MQNWGTLGQVRGTGILQLGNSISTPDALCPLEVEVGTDDPGFLSIFSEAIVTAHLSIFAPGVLSLLQRRLTSLFRVAEPCKNEAELKEVGNSKEQFL